MRSARGIYKSWCLRGGQKGVSAKRAHLAGAEVPRGVTEVGVYKAGKGAFLQSALYLSGAEAPGFIKVGVYRAGKGAFLQSAPTSPARRGGVPSFKKGVESRRLSEPVFPWQRQEWGNVSRGTVGKGVGQKSFCNLRKTLAKKKGR